MRCWMWLRVEITAAVALAGGAEAPLAAGAGTGGGVAVAAGAGAGGRGRPQSCGPPTGISGGRPGLHGSSLEQINTFRSTLGIFCMKLIPGKPEVLLIQPSCRVHSNLSCACNCGAYPQATCRSYPYCHHGQGQKYETRIWRLLVS